MFAWILDRNKLSGISFTDLCVRLASAVDPYTIEFIGVDKKSRRYNERELRSGPEYLTIYDGGVKMILCTNDSVEAGPGFFDLMTDQETTISPEQIVEFCLHWYPDGTMTVIEVSPSEGEFKITQKKRKEVIIAFLEGWPTHRPMPRLVVDDRLVRWCAYKKK